MFGVSSLGWVHTLSSLPAIPAAIYMLARHGRILPRSRAGAVYFVSMLAGALTVFPIAKQPVSGVIASITLVLLLAGYGVGRLPRLGRPAQYMETIFLTLTVFLLMLPTLTEILTRVPDGHPIAADLTSPILRGVHLSLFIALITGLTAQVIRLVLQGRALRRARG